MESPVEEFQLHRLGKEDVLLFQDLIQLFRDVFEMKDKDKATDAYLKSLLEKPGFISYVISRDNKVIGGLTAYELQIYYSAYTEIYIYDIAVNPEFQKRGLGKRLLGALKEYAQQHGVREIFVEAHEEDIHATNFYHAAGGQAEKVVHFNFPLHNRD